MKRQIFFSRVGGWDLHDNQVVSGNTATGAHANRLADVANSKKAFYHATVEMGGANSVTTFTASDFGRTYNTNGDGSDHGWGSHHLVTGGAVKGGDIYGQMPDLALKGIQDTGTRGQWIPTTSVDEYGAPGSLVWRESERSFRGLAQYRAVQLHAREPRLYLRAVDLGGASRRWVCSMAHCRRWAACNTGGVDRSGSDLLAPLPC